ncbi:MAG TPA: 4Fe-4S dicluster domain-containing protein [Thermoanaerobaculia bacterium]|nr:4Fe-4S dicluster domain-containing protein [Thermoanaerobaculia bacterium]
MRLDRHEKRYAMAIDTRRCVGCETCVLACKAENGLPLTGFRDWIVMETRGAYPDLSMEIRSDRCQHCTNAPCVSVCPTGASHYAAAGTVLVDKNLCTGCKACIAACPYDARYVHPDGYVDKCTFCLHRVERGLLPACVSNCPTNALAFGDMNDPESEISRLVRRREHKQLRTESGTHPNLYYLT